MAFQRFQSRIAVVFMGLFLLVLAAVFVAVDRAHTGQAYTQIKDALNVDSQVFTRLFDARSERLTEGVRILAGDFALRQAVASGDHGTIRSALENHRARVKANIAMLVSLDNRLQVDTRRPRMAPEPFPFTRLTEIAAARGEATSLVFLSDEAFQLVIVPIAAPEPIAWIGMGFRVDERLAGEFRDITAAHVSFLRADEEGRWIEIASTLPAALRERLKQGLPSETIGQDRPLSLAMGDEQYETRTLPLAAELDTPVVAVLQRSLDEALAPFHRLRLTLIALTGAGLLVALLGSVVVARRVTQPVAVLVEGAREIGKGHYQHAVTVRQQDELGELATALNSMAQGIAEREQRISYLAYHDEVTGLANRPAIEDQLQQRLAETGARIALLILALDRFKNINHTLGFQVGDRVLQHIGTRLQELAGAGERVARLGGGEFAVVIDGVTGIDNALHRAQEWQRHLEAPFRIDDQPFEFGMHLGISLYPEHAGTAADLVRHAEVALNHAYASPGGIGVYSTEFDQSSRRRLTLIGEARQALNTDQFWLSYQPKLDLKRRCITGVESLVRWRHPVHGFVSPADFIPVIEQTALIGPFTLSVLNMGLKQAAAWQAAGLPLKVSLNLSARNLLDPQLPEQLGQLIRLWAVAPESIVLEITESALIDNPALSIRVIHELHALGVGLSIDDYGTGYSSLSFLRQLPLAELKVDKSFVLNMLENPNDEIIVRSTVDLAHNLGLQVVAEGVETAAVLERLTAIGCDSIQGYYISKPLAAETFEAWLEQSPYRATG